MEELSEKLLQEFEAEKNPYKRVNLFIRHAIRANISRDSAQMLDSFLEMMTRERYPTEQENQSNTAWITYAKSLGMFFLPQGSTNRVSSSEEMIQHTQKALNMFEQLGDSIGQAEASINLALINWSLGNYKIAFEYGFQSVRFVQITDSNHATTARIYYNLGNFHLDTKDYASARRFFEQGLAAAREHGSEEFVLARCLVGLANVELQAHEYTRAKEYLLEAIGIQLAYGDVWGRSRSLNDLGYLAMKTGDYPVARDYLTQSLEIRRDQPNQLGYITTLIELATLSLLMQTPHQATEYIDEGIELAQKLNAKPKLYRCYEIKYEIAKMLGDYQQALEYFERFYQTKEEVMGAEESVKLREVERRYLDEMQTKEAEIERLRNVELKDAYDKIDRKNKDITASINYAKRIQEAILPSAVEMDALLPQSFVLFRPRDIVSGDFYWLRQESGKTVLACVDCTGHGIPGAFMSMIANDLLNTIITERGITEPAEILHHLKRDIFLALRQGQTQNRDGMDISIATFDPARRTLTIGAARSYFAYVQNQTLIQVKGDNLAIGGEPAPDANGFTQTTISLDSPATLYLFSDGMPDQFGGPSGRKFMLKGMRELLEKVWTLPIAQQKDAIEKELENWIGSHRQIDDVLVIGVQFG